MRTAPFVFASPLRQVGVCWYVLLLSRSLSQQAHNVLGNHSVDQAIGSEEILR